MCRQIKDVVNDAASNCRFDGDVRKETVQEVPRVCAEL